RRKASVQSARRRLPGARLLGALAWIRLDSLDLSQPNSYENLCVCLIAPERSNATLQAPPRAAARHERRLLAVACKRLFGQAPASCAPAPDVPRTPIGSPHLPGGAAMGAS